MADIDSRKLIEFLAKKWGEKSCPSCGKGPWNAQPKIYQLMEFHQGGLFVGGPVIPVIPVTCENCGHTILVNAIIAGMISPDPPKEAQSPGGTKKDSNAPNSPAPTEGRS